MRAAPKYSIARGRLRGRCLAGANTGVGGPITVSDAGMVRPHPIRSLLSSSSVPPLPSSHSCLCIPDVYLMYVQCVYETPTGSA